MSPNGEVYKEYKIGPKTEPWGTPRVRHSEFDEALLTFSYACGQTNMRQTSLALYHESQNE